MILLIPGLLGLVYLTWSIISLEKNYRKASSMGIPLVRIYVDGQNLLWMIVEPHLWPLLDRLPVNWGNFGRFSRRGWHFADRGGSHRRYGPIWAVVTPRHIYINVADATAINDVFQRRAHFLRPVEQYKILEIYGPCISTVDASNWPRHRKVLATPFNESVMSFVWDESAEQTRQMLESWTGESSGKIPSIAKDTRTVSLNVIAATGFRKSYTFQNSREDGEQRPKDSPQSYRDALQTVLDNAILLMVMPRKLLELSFAPDSWNRLARSAESFKNYMARMLDEEIKALNEGKSGAGGLMTSLVRAMDMTQPQQTIEKMSPSPPKGLTVDEIFGNIFVINFAGHDTTANTLSFAFLLLAAYPEVQDWVAEELKSLGEIDGHYVEIFPKLIRCRAIMFETLRLFPPVPSLPRISHSQPQPLQVGDRTILVPPGAGVNPNILAVQIDPLIWGDPLAWKPSRWVTLPQHTDATGGVKEEICKFPRGAFIPWSDGSQNCPGIKFSQVEFVAVVANLLRGHRLRAVPNSGETPPQTLARILETTCDVDQQLLLRMKDADRVRLTCRRV